MNEYDLYAEAVLKERLIRIRNVIRDYGEDQFYVSFSGGKDSTVLSALVDMALPGNKIPRLYADTGIELNMVRDFVKQLQKNDDRIIMLPPKVPIKKMLEKEGYPFKSKFHSSVVDKFQRSGMSKWVSIYIMKEPAASGEFVKGDHACPKILLHQFEEGYPLRISQRCCDRLKKDPLNAWAKEHNRPYPIIGIMPSEGGQRATAQCLAFRGTKFHAFQPLVRVDKEWEDWFIEKYNVQICDIYKPPYNFKRTGCKGCPFSLELQDQLDQMKQYFPAEYRQCEKIWAPVYAEYRRLGYRLRPDVGQTDIFDFIGGKADV